MEDDPLVIDVWNKMDDKYKKKVLDVVNFISNNNRTRYQKDLAWINELTENEKTVVTFLIEEMAKGTKSVLEQLYFLQKV